MQLREEVTMPFDPEHSEIDTDIAAGSDPDNPERELSTEADEAGGGLQGAAAHTVRNGSVGQ